MTSFPRACRLLLASVSLASLAMATPVHAASLDQMSLMEKQIKAMQSQLADMKREHQREMKRIHDQLAQQRQSEENDPYGTRNGYRGAPAHGSGNAAAGAGFATASAPGPNSNVLLPPVNAATPYGQLTGTPTGRVTDLYGPLHRGQIQIGGVRITLGGYVEAATMFSRATTFLTSPRISVPFRSRTARTIISTSSMNQRDRADWLRSSKAISPRTSVPRPISRPIFRLGFII